MGRKGMGLGGGVAFGRGGGKKGGRAGFAGFRIPLEGGEKGRKGLGDLSKAITDDIKKAITDLGGRVRVEKGFEIVVGRRKKKDLVELAFDELTLEDIKPSPLPMFESEPTIPDALTCEPVLERVVGENPALQEKVRQLGKAVVFTVTIPSVSGEPIQESRGRLTRENARQYSPRPGAKEKAEKFLLSRGFTVLHSGRFGITVRGPAALVKEEFDTELSVFVQADRTPTRSVSAFAAGTAVPEPSAFFVAPQGSLSKAVTAHKEIDHLVFIPPPLLFGRVSAVPPNLGYPHLEPAHIRRILNGSALQERGKGVKAAIVDTGFYPHPYFSAGGFAVTRTATPEALPADTDDVGHGTAVSLNLLEVAPAVELLCVKTQAAQGAALEIAADQGAKVVSCSWGWNYEQEFPTLAATIHALLEEGVVILFAAGNGQYAWPGSMPEVLSVGGAFADPGNKFAVEASNYASGYQSSRYPGRLVPDVAGLCGMIPKGVYIPMPCQPGCSMDVDYGKASFPDGDGTGATDGWVVASGTSSATPQVAGLVCLMLERAAKKGVALTPAMVKAHLTQSARLVTKGRNAFGFPATAAPGPNVACGYGLVDADAAINLV